MVVVKIIQKTLRQSSDSAGTRVNRLACWELYFVCAHCSLFKLFNALKWVCGSEHYASMSRAFKTKFDEAFFEEESSGCGSCLGIVEARLLKHFSCMLIRACGRGQCGRNWQAFKNRTLNFCFAEKILFAHFL